MRTGRGITPGTPCIIKIHGVGLLGIPRIKKRRVHYLAGGAEMCIYNVQRDSYKRNIWEMVGFREKIIRTIFIDNFKIYNFRQVNKTDTKFFFKYGLLFQSTVFEVQLR